MISYCSEFFIRSVSKQINGNEYIVVVTEHQLENGGRYISFVRTIAMISLI
jgi:hypothetical protein